VACQGLLAERTAASALVPPTGRECKGDGLTLLSKITLSSGAPGNVEAAEPKPIQRCTRTLVPSITNLQRLTRPEIPRPGRSSLCEPL